MDKSFWVTIIGGCYGYLWGAIGSRVLFYLFGVEPRILFYCFLLVPPMLGSWLFVVKPWLEGV